MTVKEAFDLFLFKKRLKNLSGKTIENYVDNVIPFIRYIGESIEVSEITTDLVLEYISKLYDRPLADASRATYIRHIKAFVRWLKDKYNVPVVLSEIELPKVAKKLVHILTVDELKSLFECIECESEWMRNRNCAIVAFMLSSGLRQNEVSTLLWKNIYIDQGYAYVLGKGNKERYVPLGTLVGIYLEKYRELCPYQSEFVFVERRGEPITNNAIKLLIQKLKRKTGFDFSSHKLRHNFATNYCRESLEETGQCDAFTLQVIMGHEDVKTTEGYMHTARSLIASKNSHSYLDKVFGV